MNLAFRRDDEIQNQTVKDQRSSVSVHDKIRSDQLTDKTGSPMSQREEHSGNPGVRISAGHQHIASRHRVNAKSSTFSKILLHRLSLP
jgi:hypothetical protein